MRSTDTIIISDVHLGSPVSRPADLVHTLKQWRFNKLILLGDIFDDLDFTRLHHEHWEFLSYIRTLSKPEHEVEVVWVEGNHDVGISEIAAAFLGVRVYKKDYFWKEGGVRYCAIHGHQFDRFLTHNALLSALASWLYLLIQRMGGSKQRLSRYVKRASKGWLRLSQKVSRSALRYARRHRAQVVFCGHTHQAMQAESRGVKYYNSGCWTDVPAHFISIHNGAVETQVVGVL
jgi:UDP-2,3-diacylglucosamine pyrophosphatase LpxH